MLGLFTRAISEVNFALEMAFVLNTVILPFYKKALANSKSDSRVKGH
jgi:hypothetical protein